MANKSQNIKETKTRKIPHHSKFSSESDCNISVGEGIKYNCLHHYKGQAFTIAIDWLQYACRLNLQTMTLGTDFQHTGFRWLYQGHGTQHYKHLYHVYKNNEPCFVVQISPKKSKDESIAIVKLENHLLYSHWHMHNSNFIEGCTTEIIRISRLDIAIDGLNYMRKLAYETRVAVDHSRSYKMIGKSTINGNNFNRITGLPNGLKFGSFKGNKQISIYNKSKELSKGHKPYIQDYWCQNRLPQDGDVDRFECRMLSGFLARVLLDNGQQIPAHAMFDELLSDGFKLSLIHLFVKGFFEFVYKDHKNVTRCTRINILPEKVFNMVRSPLEKRPTNYKSKLTIHNLYQQACMQKINVEDALQVMKKQLEYHELHEWYKSKLYEYSRLYVDTTGKIKQQLEGLAYTADKKGVKLMHSASPRALGAIYDQRKMKVVNTLKSLIEDGSPMQWEIEKLQPWQYQVMTDLSFNFANKRVCKGKTERQQSKTTKNFGDARKEPQGVIVGLT